MLKVWTAIISRNMPFWPHVNAFNTAAGYAAGHNIRTLCYNHVGDSLLCRARNECLYKFLQTDADYLFTLDDDVAIPPDTLTMLIKADKDMVGGMYLLKHQDPTKGQWISARLRNEEDLEKRAMEPNEKDQLMEAEYISTGCVMHKREFCQKLWDAYKGTDIEYDNLSVFEAEGADPLRVGVYRPLIHKREYLSEDWAMCQRAHDVGLSDQWVHAGVRCEHYGIHAYKFPSAWNANKVIP